MGGAYIRVYFTFIIINEVFAFIGIIKIFQFFYRLRKPMPLRSICSLNTNIYCIPIIIIHANIIVSCNICYDCILRIFRKPHWEFIIFISSHLDLKFR